MQIQSIQQCAITLKNHYQLLIVETSSLYEEVRISYCNKVLQELVQIFDAKTGGSEENITQLVKMLTEFLARNWTLINGTILSYTALPSVDLTLMLCEIATYVAYHTNGNPLKILMPSLCIESIREGYNDFNESTSLPDILQTHIQGEGGFYLLPIKLLTELDLSAKFTYFYNSYYDYLIHPPNAGYVNAKEYDRLLNHSDLTLAIDNIKKEYDTLSNGTGTLLGQLNLLCKQLCFNSVLGIGEEDNAGTGAYSAIINFMTYYHSLGKERKRIPIPLKNEINFLFELVTNKDENIDATQNLKTCITTRRSAILTAMNGYEDTLHQITVSSIPKQSLLEKITLNFETAKKELYNALRSSNYSNGADRLTLNISLLTTLKVAFKVTSQTDLMLIRSLNSSEFITLFGNLELRQQIINYIANVENLVIFILELSPQSLKDFFVIFKNELSHQLIKRSHDLSATLIPLNIEKCQIICNALIDRLPDLIFSTNRLITTLKPLEPIQCNVLCTSMGEGLSSVIKSQGDLAYVLEELEPEQCNALCQALNNSFTIYIPSINNLHFIFKYLSFEQRTAVCEAFLGQLPSIIVSIDDFHSMVSYLSLEQRLAICQAIGKTLPVLFRSIGECASVLKYLSPKQCLTACHSLNESLSDIIKSVLDFHNLMTSISQKQRPVIYQSFRENIPSIINSASDFGYVLKLLSRKQGADLCLRMANWLPDIIQSPSDIGDILWHLSLHQCDFVSRNIINIFNGIIKSNTDFRIVCRYLSFDQRAVFCKVMLDRLPFIIVSTDDFVYVLRYLTSEQRKQAYDIMLTQLPEIIQSVSELMNIMSSLSRKERLSFNQIMSNKLPSLVRTVNDLNALQSLITPDQCKVLLGSFPLRSLISNIINSCSIEQTKPFKNALLNNNNEQIKARFYELVHHSNTRNLRHCSMFKKTYETPLLKEVFGLLSNVPNSL